MHSGLERLAVMFQEGQLTRRQLLFRARGFVGGVALASFLAACGADEEDAPAPADTGTEEEDDDSTGVQPAPDSDEDEEPDEVESDTEDDDGPEEEVEDDTEQAAEGEPQSGGTFNFAITADPLLNPLITSGVHSVMVNKTLFNGLTRPEPETLLPVPDLATSWESNEELTQWTFELRDDVLWHDGEQFTADDVVFTYERRQEEDGVAAAFPELESVEKVDDYTVQFNLSEPVSLLPTLLSYNQFIVPQHALEGTPLTDNTEFSNVQPIGTGPYKVEEFSQGNYVSTVKNEDFFHGEPLIDRFVFHVLPDVNTQVAQIRTGELTFVTIEPQNVETVENEPNLIIDPIWYVNHYYIAFQVERELFSDQNVRLGLAHAIDRQAIVDRVALGYGRVATGTVPHALEWAYDDSLEPIPFDPDRALEILAESGWEEGEEGFLERDGERLAFTLSVDTGNPAREQTATIVQQQFRDIGCDVELETMDWASFSQQRWLGEDYDAMHMWWITPPDPDQSDFYGCGGASNHPNFCNEEMTEILEAGRRTADMEERQELYYEYQRMQLEDPPVSVLYYPQEIRVYPDHLRGVVDIGIRDVLIYSYQMWLDE